MAQPCTRAGEVGNAYAGIARLMSALITDASTDATPGAAMVRGQEITRLKTGTSFSTLGTTRRMTNTEALTATGGSFEWEPR